VRGRSVRGLSGRHGWSLLPVMIALVGLMVGPSQAATPTATDEEPGPPPVVATSRPSRGLEILQPPKRVVIRLATSDRNTTEGWFSLLLRNAGRAPLQPRLTLFPQADIPVLRLSSAHDADSPMTAALQSPDPIPTIHPGRAGRISVHVLINSRLDPASLDGTVAIESVAGSHKVIGPTVYLSVVSAGLDLSDVSVVPSDVTIHTTTWGPRPLPVTGKMEPVEVRGLGAAAWIAVGVTNRAILHSDDGHSATVQFEFHRTRTGPPQPTIRVLGRPEAGAYTGTLPITNNPQTPTVAVKVLAHDAVIWALLAVGLGTLLGGLLPLLGERARRRDLLRARLQGILIDYFGARRRGASLKWTDLSDSVGTNEKPWRSTEWMAAPGLRGAAGLFSAIRWAQTDADFTDIETRVNTLMARIARWLKIRPKVQALDELRGQAVPDIAGTKWANATTRRHSQRLVIDAQRNEPATDDDTAATVRRLDNQMEWHGGVTAAWHQLAATESHVDPGQFADLLTELRVLASPHIPPADRTPDQWTDLTDELEEFLAKLASARPTGALSGSAPMVQYIDDLQVRTEAPRRGLHPLQTLRRPVDAVRGIFRSRRSKPLRLIIASQRRDLLLSIIAALGAILAYVVPLYTDTWGTTSDYLTAIAAGFGAQAIVRWGALPIFESRLSRT
jgi:hypothetical protein